MEKKTNMYRNQPDSVKPKIFQVEKKTNMYRNQPDSVKPKIRGPKSRQIVNLQGVLKQKRVKQGLGVLCLESWSCHTLEKRHTERVRSV